MTDPKVTAAKARELTTLTNEAVTDLQAGRDGEGVSKLRAVLRVDPHHALALLNLGMALMDEDPEEARTCFVQSLKISPSMPQALTGLAMVESSRGRYKQSVFFFKRAIQADPTSADLYFNLANDLLKLSITNEAEAIRNYRKAIEIEPAHSDAGLNLSITLGSSGSLREAIDVAKNTLQCNPSSLAVRITLAELSKQGGDPETAVNVLKPVVERLFGIHAELQAKQTATPKFPWSGTDSDAIGEAMAVYGSSLQVLNKKQDAITAYRMAATARENGTGSALLKLGLEYRLREATLLMETDQWESAATSLITMKKLLEKSLPDDTIGRSILDELISYSSDVETDELDVLNAPLSHTAEQAILHMRLLNAQSVTSKCLLAEATKGMSYVPDSYLVHNLNETLAVMDSVSSKTTTASTSWFLKDPNVQRGQGITIFRYNSSNKQLEPSLEESIFDSKKPYVLQREIHPALIDNTKFGVRLHVLVVRCNATGNIGDAKLLMFLFPEGILTKCASPYAEDSHNPLAQITCTSVQRTLPSFKREQVKGPASKLWSDYTSCIPEVKSSLLSSLCLCHRASSLDGYSEEPAFGTSVFQVFGCDLLFQNDNKQPIVVEFNSSPQFQDAKTLESLQQTVAKPMINGILNALRRAKVIVKECSYDKVDSESLNLSTWHYVGVIE